MAKFVLSAFSDEYSHDFDEQLEGLAKNGLSLMEIRGVNGKNISAVTPDEARELKKKLDDAGIAVGASVLRWGRPLSDDYEERLEPEAPTRTGAQSGHREYPHVLILPAQDVDPITCRGEVMEKLSGMLKIVQEDGGTIKLCHEREGHLRRHPERCYDIRSTSTRRSSRCSTTPTSSAAAVKPTRLPMSCWAIPSIIAHQGADYNSKIYAAGKGLGAIPETLPALNAKRDNNAHCRAS